MENYQKYLDPQTLARLEGLQLRARLIVEGYVSGVHRSPYHGFSIEFAEHREYAPGDDLRYVDWKVFGRTDKFYLKQYEEETNLVCYLLLTPARACAIRAPAAPMSKLEYAQCVAAALAYLVLQQQDSVGWSTFDQRDPRAGPRQQQPVAPEATAARDGAIARRAEDGASGRSSTTWPSGSRSAAIVIVLSDLFDDVDSMLAGSEALPPSPARGDRVSRARPGRAGFPVPARRRCSGAWSNCPTCWSSRALRKAYLREFDDFLRRVKNGCRMHRIDYVPCGPTSRWTWRCRATWRRGGSGQ